MDHEELVEHVLEAYRNPASTLRDRVAAHAALKDILDHLDAYEAALREIGWPSPEDDVASLSYKARRALGEE